MLDWISTIKCVYLVYNVPFSEQMENKFNQTISTKQQKANKTVVAKSNEIMALAKVLDTFLIVPPSLSVVSGHFSDAFKVYIHAEFDVIHK